VHMDWTVAVSEPALARREAFGLAVHPRCVDRAVVYGGLSDDTEVLGDMWSVTYCPRDDADDDYQPLQLQVLTVTGDVPVARYRHGFAAVGGSTGTFAMFGGEDGDGTLLNDLHCFEADTGVWRAVECNTAPPPRFLPFVWAVSDSTESSSVYVAGGAAFLESALQRSFDDVWRASIEESSSGTPHATWLRDERNILVAPTNGGACVCRAGTAPDKRFQALLVGGKDGATGSNESVALSVTAQGEVSSWLRLPVENESTPCDSDDADTFYRGKWPHWRYQTAATLLEFGRHAFIVVIAGQCRHPDPVHAYAASVSHVTA
jgi:hypothetical protein